MIKEMVCIECPQGCLMKVEVDENTNKVISLSENRCPKGEKYALEETENPVRIITSTVRAQGLSVSMVPVRSREGIPKKRIMDVMEKIREIRVSKPVEAGEVIVRDVLGLGTDIIATRKISKQ